MRSRNPDRPRRPLGPFALAALGCLAAPVYGVAAVQWEQLAPGVKTTALTFQTSQKRSVAVTFVVAVPNQLKVRVVDVYQTLGSGSAAYGYSLDEVFEKVRPLVAINGGPTGSFTLPMPVGLLMTAGRIRAPLNRKARNSAFVCFPESGRPRMGWASGFNPFNCDNAVQSAPLLVLKRDRVVSEGKEESRRSVVAFTTEGDVVFLQTDPISFLDLARQLMDASPVAIENAMCLDGSSSSGLIFRSGAEVRRAGSTGNLIASAITIDVPKRRR